MSIIDHKIFGDDMQIVEIELDKGEAVRAEAGALLYMENGIEMQTSSGGGIWKGFKRMLTGDGFFITSFQQTLTKCRSAAGCVSGRSRSSTHRSFCRGGLVHCSKVHQYDEHISAFRWLIV